MTDSSKSRKLARLEEICRKAIAEREARAKEHAEKYPNDTLAEFLKRAGEEMKGREFKPYAYYNADGDELEAIWSGDRDYCKQVGQVFDLCIGIETEQPVGVKVFALRRLCAESGMMLVDYEAWSELAQLKQQCEKLKRERDGLLEALEAITDYAEHGTICAATMPKDSKRHGPCDCGLDQAWEKCKPFGYGRFVRCPSSQGERGR